MCVCDGEGGGRTDFAKIKIINTRKYTNAKQYNHMQKNNNRMQPKEQITFVTYSGIHAVYINTFVI